MGIDEWAKYQKFDVMERADLYAKTNNIKRTGTFVKQMTKHKQRKQTNLDKAYDKALKEEEEKAKKNETESLKSGEDKLEVYVPSKLGMDKVASMSKTEDEMTTSIELSEPKKEEDVEEQLIKSEDANHEKNDTVVVKEDEEDADDENEKEDYVKVDNKEEYEE